MITLGNTIIRILDAYPFQLAVCIHLFAIGFRRRKLFFLRLFLYILPMLLIFDVGSQAFPNGLSSNLLLDKTILLLPMVYTFLGVLFCYQTTWISALYCCACAYPVQNFLFNLYWITKIKIGFVEGTFQSLCWSLSLMLLIYSIAYFLLKKKIGIISGQTRLRKRIVLITLLISFLVVFFDFRVTGSPFELYVYISYLMADVLAIIIQFSISRESDLEARNAVMDDLLQSERKKQQMTTENIELINRKCHDLKHQIAGIRRMKEDEERNAYIKEIEKAVMFYESAVKTGNETLDLIMMEKLLYCQEHHIKLTCISNGEKLKYLDTMDIYSLFGNAIDNAIESVSAEKEEQNRIISLRIGTRGQLLTIHIENYLGHDLKLTNGLPVTTKEDNQYHGFGVLSIQHIVKKYDGIMSIRTDNRLFRMDIIIPLKQ